MWQQRTLRCDSRGRGFYPLTEAVTRTVRETGLRAGLCHLFLRHTSASLCITENVDPEVHRDLERFAERLVPDGDPLFRHDQEGPDDMPAHVRNLVAGFELTVPVVDGGLALGTWQGIYLWEHRSGTRCREVMMTLHGSLE